MDSLDRDNTSSLGASPSASDQLPEAKNQLLSLGLDQPIPELNIQLSPWDAFDWETKAATAAQPYTPSYASFNSPSSNVSALSGPDYDPSDPSDYMASGANNNTSYMSNPNDDEQYDPLAYSTGNEPTFGLLADDFASSGDYLNDSSQPRLQLPEPEYQGGSQGQYGQSQYYTHRADPEHSPSPASSAGEIEQQNYTGGQAGGQGVGASHQPSPMMGNNLPPLGFSEGLANLNFGGAQSPPEGYTNFQQHQLSRVPTPISVGQSSDASSPQHPSAGASASASSPGTPGSTSGRPVIITTSLDSLSSPPAQSSSSDTQQYDAYLNAQQHQQQQLGATGGDAPNILLIPSSPAGLLPSQQDTSAQQSQHSVNAPNPELSAQRPPGLHDFLGESSRPSAGSVNPSHMFSHRPRSHSSSDIVRMTQQGGVQINNLGSGYGNSLTPNIPLNLPMYNNFNNGGVGLQQPQQLPRLGGWQDPTLYSYPGTQRTINPNEAFGQQQQQQQQLELENLVTLPQSPDHGTQSLPGTASYHQPGMHTYQSAPVLSITNHSSSMQPSLSNPQQHPSPSGSFSSNSTAAQGYFAPQSSSLEPGSWNVGGVGLRRNKTHTGTMSGHRRGAQSEDIRSTTGANWNSPYGGTTDFLRSITSADGSLAPPSGSSSSVNNTSSVQNTDALGLGGSSGYAASDASTIYDEELNGGVGAARGRRRTSSAASDRSPYSRPHSISPSRSPIPYNPSIPADYYPPGSSGAAVPGANGETTVPVSAVERQHVTTPATELASQSRRKNKAPFVCPVEGCGSTFTRQFNLKGHLRSHREERPYVCKWPKCGKGFARQHDCKRHEALHLNIRPFTCEGCGKTFARMDALNRHHKSEGGVECRGNGSDDGGNNGADDSYNGDGGNGHYFPNNGGGGTWNAAPGHYVA